MRQSLEDAGVAVGELAVSPNGRTSPDQATGRDTASAIPAGQTDSPSVSSVGGQISALGLSVNSVASQSNAAPASKSGMLADATPMEQIGEQVQITLSRGGQDTTIQLHPKELGVVRIRLQMEDGQLHLSIRAEQQDTGRMLHSKLAELRQSLEGQGIKVGELAVSRGERTLPVEAMGREVTPAVRSGQMDMNPNDAPPQRQQTAFTTGNFGSGNFAGGQNPHRQEAGTGSTGIKSADILPPTAPRQKQTTTRGPVGVDYYA